MRWQLKLQGDDWEMANIGGIYFWTQSDVNALFKALSSLQSKVDKLLTQEQTQMSALDDLKAAVQETQDAEQAATTLIQGIAKQLSDALANNSAAANDPVLAELRDKLNSSAAELSAAITANTPVDPNAPQVNPLSGRR